LKKKDEKKKAKVGAPGNVENNQIDLSDDGDD